MLWWVLDVTIEIFLFKYYFLQRGFKPLILGCMRQALAELQVIQVRGANEQVRN
jgi:hypothetical protein